MIGPPGILRRDAGRIVAALVYVLAALQLPAVASAQPPRPIRIGVLTPSWGPTPGIVGLREGLRELGYRDREDFVIGVRFTQGDVAALPSAALEIVSQGVDVLVVDFGEAARAARDATSRIPILLISGVDPVREGLAQSYARPGGNLTGVAGRGLELVPKRLEVFRDSVPGLKRVLFVYDATSPRASAELDTHRDAAQRLGLELVERPVRLPDEARRAFDQVRRGQVHGIILSFSVNLNIPGLAVESSPRLGVPVMCANRFFAERGGFAGYGDDDHAAGRQAARLMDKILKGVPPGEIPIERNEQIEFTLNLKVARALGIVVPPAMRTRVDHVFQ